MGLCYQLITGFSLAYGAALRPSPCCSPLRKTLPRFSSDRSITPSRQNATPTPSPYVDLVGDKSFSCTECGKCCTGSGEIWCNTAEYTAIARHLGMDTKFFLAQYAKAYSKRPGWRLLKRKHRSADCIFLKADNKCGIYGARPLQCATYPWWPELMGDRAWAAEAAAVCEGISHPDAPAMDVAHAAAQLQAQTEHEGEYDRAVLTSRTGGTWNL